MPDRLRRTLLRAALAWPALGATVPVRAATLTSEAERAMAASLEALLFEQALAPDARRQLLDWMRGSTTGGERIRAGVPAGWDVADKTGTGAYGTTNDVGAVFSAQGKPLVVAIYYADRAKDAAADNGTVAVAAEIVAKALADA